MTMIFDREDEFEVQPSPSIDRNDRTLLFSSAMHQASPLGTGSYSNDRNHPDMITEDLNAV